MHRRNKSAEPEPTAKGCCPTCGGPLAGLSLRFDVELGVVIAAGRVAYLTDHEMEIFVMLHQAFPRVVSKSNFMDQLYGTESTDDPDEKIVDVWVCKVRAKLEPLGIVIDTVWGRGWRIVMLTESTAKAVQLISEARS